jgi:hypothetical protein
VRCKNPLVPEDGEDGGYSGGGAENGGSGDGGFETGGFDSGAADDDWNTPAATADW